MEPVSCPGLQQIHAYSKSFISTASRAIPRRTIVAAAPMASTQSV